MWPENGQLRTKKNERGLRGGTINGKKPRGKVLLKAKEKKMADIFQSVRESEVKRQ